MITFIPVSPTVRVLAIRSHADLQACLNSFQSGLNSYSDSIDSQTLAIVGDSIVIPAEYVREGVDLKFVGVGDFMVASENGEVVVTSNPAVADGDFSSLPARITATFYRKVQ